MIVKARTDVARNAVVFILLAIAEYRDSFHHPFLLRKTLDLPAGTVIRGVPHDATILLIPAAKSKP